MTANNDMVDRVAQAIYEARNGPRCKPFAHQPQSHRDPYRADARAALAAMSELLRQKGLSLTDAKTSSIGDLYIGGSFLGVAEGIDAALKREGE